MTEAATESVARAIWDLDFDVAKSIRYHAYRRSFWEGFDSTTKIFTTLSGTAVLVSIIGEKSGIATMFAFMVAAFSIGDVVFGFSSKARRHDMLYREFSLLAQKIVELQSASDEDVRMLRRRRLEIEMEEPGILDWLERRCAGEECRARNCEMRDEWRLRPLQVALSQWAWWPARL